VQMQTEMEERNVKRVQLMLENEFQRQKVQADLQCEIERQWAATEMNQIVVQTKMLERREVENLM